LQDLAIKKSAATRISHHKEPSEAVRPQPKIIEQVASATRPWREATEVTERNDRGEKTLLKPLVSPGYRKKLIPPLLSPVQKIAHAAQTFTISNTKDTKQLKKPAFW